MSDKIVLDMRNGEQRIAKAKELLQLSGAAAGAWIVEQYDGPLSMHAHLLVQEILTQALLDTQLAFKAMVIDDYVAACLKES